jgi:hypothetical protein
MRNINRPYGPLYPPAIAMLALLGATPALAQNYYPTGNPHNPASAGGTTNNVSPTNSATNNNTSTNTGTNTSRNNNQSSASNRTTISHSGNSRSTAQGAINGSVNNGSLSSSADPTINVYTSGSAGKSGGSYSSNNPNGAWNGGGSGRNGRNGTNSSDPPGVNGTNGTSAADPPALGSAANPLTENIGGTQTIRNVPEIVAPNISGGNPCLTGFSGGGAGPGIGVTVGIGWEDKDCARRANAALLNNLGQHAAAIALLCQNDAVARALAATGSPCTASARSDGTPYVVSNAPSPATTVAADPPPIVQAHAVDAAVIRRQQEVAVAPTPLPAAYTPPKLARPDYCYTATVSELKRHPECTQ